MGTTDIYTTHVPVHSYRWTERLTDRKTQLLLSINLFVKEDPT